MNRQHNYSLINTWTGNTGDGTSGYRSYERSHFIHIEDKADILVSSDPAFRGDKTRHNPEELLLASLSSCHMLWYLHLCAEAGVIVVDYKDKAEGTMIEADTGGGHFTEVVLNPVVKVTDSSMIAMANDLHGRANELCFIANSVKFKVAHNPVCLVAAEQDIISNAGPNAR